MNFFKKIYTKIVIATFSVTVLTKMSFKRRGEEAGLVCTQTVEQRWKM